MEIFVSLNVALVEKVEPALAAIFLELSSVYVAFSSQDCLRKSSKFYSLFVEATQMLLAKDTTIIRVLPINTTIIKSLAKTPDDRGVLGIKRLLKHGGTIINRRKQ
jgi:hypothetical protein